MNDIAGFAASLLPQAESLLREWYPAGKLRGHEFVVGSLNGEEGDSLSVNTKTGLWADFADESLRGGDLVSLYAAREGIKQGEAAKQLGWHGTNGATLAPVTAEQATADLPPLDPPALPGGPYSAIYDYCQLDGQLLFRIARTDTETGKTFRPFTWRNGKWSAKAWPKPRPLFGLETLQEGQRILIVEGEKASLAARQLLPMYVCLTWAGGAASVKTADWSPLYGRDVDLWPDADPAGSVAMATVGEQLLPHIGAGQLRLLKQDGQPEGWDLADALAEGWTIDRLTAHVRRDNDSHVHLFGQLQVGRPHDGGEPPIEQEETPRRSINVLRSELQLVANDGGIPYPTEHNALQFMSKHPDFAGRLWLDEFAQELMYDDKPFDKVNAIQALLWAQQNLHFHKLPLTAIERAALIVGAANAKHPVRNWLNGLKWDGTERLNTFMADAFGTPQNAYHASVGRCWLISLVARIYEPGCQADYMPVFEGSQGIYKSSAMRALGGQWFMESHEDPIHSRKDFLLSLQGHWLIEIPEMHAIAGRGNGIEKIKGIITNRTDNYREPYGHRVRPYPRQCIFAGTTNAEQWNPDPTGGRRFWPIRCGLINVAYIASQREQLFAEAVSKYRLTHNWYDVPAGDAKAEQEARRETDAWEELILSHVEWKKIDTVTVAQLLRDCLNIEPGKWTQNDQNRVAKALRANGFAKTRLGNADRTWAYRRPHYAEPVSEDTF